MTRKALILALFISVATLAHAGWVMPQPMHGLFSCTGSPVTCTQEASGPWNDAHTWTAATASGTQGVCHNTAGTGVPCGAQPGDATNTGDKAVLVDTFTTTAGTGGDFNVGTVNNVISAGDSTGTVSVATTAASITCTHGSGTAGHVVLEVGNGWSFVQKGYANLSACTGILQVDNGGKWIDDASHSGANEATIAHWIGTGTATRAMTWNLAAGSIFDGDSADSPLLKSSGTTCNVANTCPFGATTGVNGTALVFTGAFNFNNGTYSGIVKNIGGIIRSSTFKSSWGIDMTGAASVVINGATFVNDAVPFINVNTAYTATNGLQITGTKFYNCQFPNTAQQHACLFISNFGGSTVTGTATIANNVLIGPYVMTGGGSMAGFLFKNNAFFTSNGSSPGLWFANNGNAGMNTVEDQNLYFGQCTSPGTSEQSGNCKGRVSSNTLVNSVLWGDWFTMAHFVALETNLNNGTVTMQHNVGGYTGTMLASNGQGVILSVSGNPTSGTAATGTIKDNVLLCGAFDFGAQPNGFLGKWVGLVSPNNTFLQLSTQNNTGCGGMTRSGLTYNVASQTAVGQWWSSEGTLTTAAVGPVELRVDSNLFFRMGDVSSPFVIGLGQVAYAGGSKDVNMDSGSPLPIGYVGYNAVGNTNTTTEAVMLSNTFQSGTNWITTDHTNKDITIQHPISFAHIRWTPDTIDGDYLIPSGILSGTPQTAMSYWQSNPTACGDFADTACTNSAAQWSPVIDYALNDVVSDVQPEVTFTITALSYTGNATTGTITVTGTPAIGIGSCLQFSGTGTVWDTSTSARGDCYAVSAISGSTVTWYPPQIYSITQTFSGSTTGRAVAVYDGRTTFWRCKVVAGCTHGAVPSGYRPVTGYDAANWTAGFQKYWEPAYLGWLRKTVLAGTKYSDPATKQPLYGNFATLKDSTGTAEDMYIIGLLNAALYAGAQTNSPEVWGTCSSDDGTTMHNCGADTLQNIQHIIPQPSVN